MTIDEGKNRFYILIVDDDENTRFLIKRILSDDRYVLETAADGKEALEKLTFFHPDIIVCDIMMPNMDGYEFRDAIRDKEEYHLTSFVFISAKTGTEDRIRGLESGVDAYITKPFDTKEFLALINAMTAKRLQLEKLVNHDALTKVFNKRKILSELDRELLRVRRYNHPLGVMIFDIDHFKQVNDTYGHPEGDMVLEALSAIARQTLREIDMIGRFGGEEFLVLMPETDLAGAVRFGDRLRKRLHQTPMGERQLIITVSMGIVIAPDDGDQSTVLIKKADEALYTAKRSGRDRVIHWGDSPD